MNSNFQNSLRVVLRDEGGNDDDPDDPGGRTSRGIEQAEYNAFRKLSGLPTADVWKADDSEIMEIYRDSYWNPYCDGFPLGTDFLYFDCAVNAGPHEATLLLQRAVGVDDDGHIGVITKAAVDAANRDDLIRKFSDEKRAFYRALHKAKYIKGWLNRCDDVEGVALAMVAGAK